MKMPMKWIELGVPAEGELLAIADLAKQRHIWRKAQGAISIQLPESSIKVDGDADRNRNVRILPLARNGRPR